MAKASIGISRRSMFSSALVAGAALTIPVAALAQTETSNDKDTEVFQKPLAVLGRALHDGRLEVKWSKSKTGKIEGSKFTIWLNGTEGVEFMGAILAGTVFAGLITAEEIIAKLEKNTNASKKEVQS